MDEKSGKIVLTLQVRLNDAVSVDVIDGQSEMYDEQHCHHHRVQPGTPDCLGHEKLGNADQGAQRLREEVHSKDRVRPVEYAADEVERQKDGEHER